MLSACAGDSAPSATASRIAAPSAAAASRADAAVQQDLAALRAATARYHRIEVAQQEGWDTQFPAGCFSSAAGGMGFHWLNGTNVGTLDPARPQLVLYEPQKDGSMKLVGIEYIYPGLETDTPPVLFGQDFKWNATFQVWALHAWVWKENPRGMFKDYNPVVSCEYAAAAATASHH
jgi:hypothetical protein